MRKKSRRMHSLKKENRGGSVPAPILRSARGQMLFVRSQPSPASVEWRTKRKSHIFPP